MKRNDTRPAPSYLLSALIGGIAGFALLLLLCIPAALLLPHASGFSPLLFPLALGISAVSGFFCGIIGGRKTRARNAFLGALSAGGVLLVLLLLASLIFPERPETALPRFVPALCALVASALAGMTVSSHRGKPRTHF